MTNLYKLLKPQYKKVLNANCRKYDSAQRVKYTLLSKASWNELTITDFKNLMLWTDMSTTQVSVHDLLYGDNIIKQKW